MIFKQAARKECVTTVNLLSMSHLLKIQEQRCYYVCMLREHTNIICESLLHILAHTVQLGRLFI